MSRMLRFKDEAEFARFRKSANAVPMPKRSKYNAQRVEVDGVRFDSNHEAERYRLLRDLERRGAIRNLRLHVPLHCEINGRLVCTLMVDFVYDELGADGRVVAIYEDAKGMRRGTAYQLFRVKQKLAEAIHGIKIDEV
jgi:hypothetical protein